MSVLFGGVNRSTFDKHPAFQVMMKRTRQFLIYLLIFFLSRRLTNEDFRRLSKHIVEQFPGEWHQVYFTSPIKKRNSKDSKSGIARGKLIDKYRNRLTLLRQSGILSAKYLDKECINTSEPNEENLEDGMQFCLIIF